MPENAPTIAARIAAVQAAVEAVEREEAHVQGAKANYRYKYISESAMFDFIRPLLAEHGIATVQRTNLLSADGNMVRVSVEVDFIATEGDGEDWLTATMVAQATDQGDKALAKAITSATRYLYWKTFRFPAEDPAADPEAQSTAHETAADRQAAQLVGKARELATRKGVRGSFENVLAEHLKATGLFTAHPDFVRPYIAQMEALPDALKADAPAGQGATPAQASGGAQADAQAPMSRSEAIDGQPEHLGGSPGRMGEPDADPFGVLDGAEPEAQGDITDEQKTTIIAIVSGENGLEKLKPAVDWTAKLAEKCAEWYDGHTDWETLSKDQAADLATRLETVRLALAEKAVS